MAVRMGAALARWAPQVGRQLARPCPRAVPLVTAFEVRARAFSSHPDFEPQRHTEGAEQDVVQEKLKKLVEENKVVLFMKGSPDAPQCGFSRTVASVLQAEGFQDYAYVDVLKYPEVREGVKKFSDWPTVPQLYVKGEFIGGCDIVLQMHREGELKPVLDKVVE
mmetsp:Transcript_83778/g.194902  ORF Transcript_83778/g.194902 Transcript_83778/m.194902 type:complete len:164 (-) Transcript_83778:86-577(-)|eukprot:CAMPEP_0171099268 /NCGR_PEP_ID=MMETSP0766_2-20121228/50991_1 /TAXON_ID=439317 /ORGANISM="Gambierdiscus australes, Strain CAWD 149" /LENGTH=163 /DNA_ID=CAMNT_0011558849 /DNA_START=62 /DNA_END=553 /DNA_ORIENTATION=+